MAKVKITENCKLASEWEPKNPHENVEHDKALLKELGEKFRPFFERHGARAGNLALNAMARVASARYISCSWQRR